MRSGPEEYTTFICQPVDVTNWVHSWATSQNAISYKEFGAIVSTNNADDNWLEVVSSS